MHTTIHRLTDLAIDTGSHALYSLGGHLDQLHRTSCGKAHRLAGWWREGRAAGRYFQELAANPRASLIDLHQPVAGELEHLDS